jgi:DNA-binding Xre family transcriptional regulator
LYHQENECRSRWYQGVKNTASQNIKMKTLIKLSTAFEMSPGELMDYIIDFDKKKK